MPLFMCEGCGSVENTALSNYWTREKGTPALCSACDPETRRWHGEFEQRRAVGMIIGGDGFLYYPQEFVKRQVHHTKPVRELTEQDMPR
jgi:hypothetical protein